MNTLENVQLLKSARIISNEVGILSHITKLPILNKDPQLISYGIWPCQTSFLGGGNYTGASSGCGYHWKESILGTIGETVERYSASFHDLSKMIPASYKTLGKPAVHPKEYALFHEKQYAHPKFSMQPFTEDTELYWTDCIDLTTGQETWTPATFVYMPWTADKTWVTINSSTGLAAHTNYYKAIQTAMYEVLERDSFVMTWLHNLVTPKIKISNTIQKYLNNNFPEHYEWHFFDITYDLEVPCVFGLCFGEAEFGKFVAIGASARATYGEALQKTIKEIGQGVSYFRYLLGEKKDWEPAENFQDITDFDLHSILYTKRPELWHVFDKWRDAVPTKEVDLFEKSTRTPQQEIQHMLTVLKNKGYNVLFKDITTPDVNQLGFYSIRIVIPQLIQLSGIYTYYFNGSERLYTVPKACGYQACDYDNLNPMPHPFP